MGDGDFRKFIKSCLFWQGGLAFICRKECFRVAIFRDTRRFIVFLLRLYRKTVFLLGFVFVKP